MSESSLFSPMQLAVPGTRLALLHVSSNDLAAAEEAGLNPAQMSFKLKECILEVLSDERLMTVLPKSFHGETGSSLLKACKSVGFVEAIFPIQDTEVCRPVCGYLCVRVMACLSDCCVCMFACMLNKIYVFTTASMYVCFYMHIYVEECYIK